MHRERAERIRELLLGAPRIEPDPIRLAAIAPVLSEMPVEILGLALSIAQLDRDLSRRACVVFYLTLGWAERRRYQELGNALLDLEPPGTRGAPLDAVAIATAIVTAALPLQCCDDAVQAVARMPARWRGIALALLAPHLGEGALVKAIDHVAALTDERDLAVAIAAMARAVPAGRLEPLRRASIVKLHPGPLRELAETALETPSNPETDVAVRTARLFDDVVEPEETVPSHGWPEAVRWLTQWLEPSRIRRPQEPDPLETQLRAMLEGVDPDDAARAVEQGLRVFWSRFADEHTKLSYWLRAWKSWDSMAEPPKRIQGSPRGAAGVTDISYLDPRRGVAPLDRPAQPRASFLFLLRGDRARRDAICAHSDACLEFRFEVPTADALALVDDTALDEARRSDLDIMLEVTAHGQLALHGPCSGVAQFRQGVMLSPVVFHLEATERDTEHSHVHVDFIVKGETIYQQELKIAVVADEDELQRWLAGTFDEPRVPLTLLTDAASASPPAEHQVRMKLAFVHEGLGVELTHLIDGKSHFAVSHVARGFDRARLETLVRGVQSDLESIYLSDAWRCFDGSLADGEAGRATQATLRRAQSAVAAAGCRLGASLREDEALMHALDYIEQQVPDGAVLTIATSEVFLPWEIVYPRHWSEGFTDAQKAANPLEPGAFWGVRFALETVHGQGTGSIAALKRTQLEHQPRISLNLNPRIDIAGLDASRQPVAVQKTWAGDLDAKGNLDGIQDSCAAIRHVLQDAASAATFIYVYCHGSAANPFGGSDEVLVLDEGCKLSVGDLEGDTPYPGAPIVFLNSCQSAAHSPLAFSNFLREFRRRGALGMIAASFPVPVVFACHFGREVVERYLQRRGSLARALRDLRRRHLLERGNPIPLFYTLQCQLTFPSPS